MSEQSTYAEPARSRVIPAAARDTAGKNAARNDGARTDVLAGKAQDGGHSSPVIPLIQARLTVNAPDDPYEKEADDMADRVMRFPAAGSGRAAGDDPGSYSGGVQAKCEECRKEEELRRRPEVSFLQRQPLPGTLQRQPLSALLQRQEEGAGEVEEEEAVQAKAEDEEAVQAKAEDEEAVQAKAEDEEAVQAKAEEEEEPEAAAVTEQEEEESVQAKEEKDEEPLQAKAEDEEAVQAREEEDEGAVQARPAAAARRRPGHPGRSFVQTLRASKGQGAPLSASTRHFMERSFGADFGGVRIHTGGVAAQLSQGIRAQAFTHGGDIYFNEGKYAPESREGGHLLAHELTHTIQQGASPLLRESQAPGGQSPEPAMEPPAEFAAGAELASGGEPASIGEAAPVGAGEVIPDTRPDPAPPLQLNSEAGESIRLAPQLLEAVRKARSEIGKVDAKKVDEDGTRHGWQRLWEYFRIAFGKNKTVPEDVVKHIRTSGGSDAMPSWCGIFIWWAYKKSGIDVPDWRFGGGQVSELEVFPPSHVPQPGDIAYRNEKSHYAIVSDITQAPEGSKRNEWKVTTVNGNTTGNNNLGGQIEEKTETLGGRWHAFFNPATGMDLPTVQIDVSDIRTAGTGNTPGNTPGDPSASQADQPAPEDREERQEQAFPQVRAGRGPETGAETTGTDPGSIEEEEVDLQGDPRLKQPAGGGEAIAEVKAITFSGSSEEMTTGFSQASPSQMAASYASMGDAVSDQLSTEKSETQEALPELNASNTGVEEQVAQKEPMPADESAREIAGAEEGAGAPETEFEPHEFAGPPPSNKEAMDRKERNMGESFWEWITSNFFNNIQTTDPDLDTSAGERPVIDTTGDADPGRSEVQKADATAQVGDKKKQTEQQILDNPGQDRIQPVLVDERYPAKLGKDRPEPVGTPEEETLQNYTGAALPEEVRNAADKKLAQGMEAKMAKQRDAINAAAGERDDNKKKSIDEAEKETADLNKESTREQVKAVKDNRAKVVADQQKGIRETQDKMKAYEEEAGKEQQGVDNEVSDRIRTDNEEAGKKLDKAEEEAARKKEEGEKEAERIRKEEEKKNEDRSWWDWAKDAVKSAVKFVTDAIDAVFDKIRKAVKDLIDAAKKLALDLIEAGRKWIVDKLNKFRDWLKEKVNKYLADFPAVRDAINGAIDKTVDFAVDTVNKTADALKKGVEWVADKLASAIDSILAKFQAGLKAAVQIMGAVLTGDLAEALKIAFMAACEIAGVDPGPILGFMNRVKEFLLDIFKAPLKFITNVGKGIQGGLNLFFSNIKKHLIGGVISWLTGALSEVPIKLPDTWDLKGIFYLVAQILGVTYQNIRAKVIKRLGPKGAKVIEAIEQASDFVIALITGGPVAVWELIKEKVSNLKEMVISQLSQWLTITVIKEGIIWLLSLTNPASALVKAVKMLFDVVMFLVERFEQIRDFVLSVYGALTEIVNGNLEKVAAAVERALARTVPVLIGLLASVLGLGGIGKTVTKILKKVRKPIDKAMDFVIDKIVAFGKKLIKAVAGGAKKVGGKVKEGAKKLKDKVVQWWKAKKRFTAANGESHTIYFKGTGNNAQLMIRSTPTPILAFLKEYERAYSPLSEDKAAKLKTARAYILSDIQPLTKQLKTAKTEEKKADLNNLLLQKFTVLSEQLKELLGKSRLKEGLEKYHLEGLSGTYGSMPKPRYDALTADHQPQAAVLIAAAKQPFFKQKAVVNLRRRAEKRADAGYAINLHAIRHKAGRTYGGKGGSTKRAFLDALKSRVKNEKSVARKREITVELLKAELTKDVTAMQAVARSSSKEYWSDIRNDKDLTKKEKETIEKKVRDQILAGEAQIASQNLDNLKQ